MPIIDRSTVLGAWLDWFEHGNDRMWKGVFSVWNLMLIDPFNHLSSVIEGAELVNTTWWLWLLNKLCQGCEQSTTYVGPVRSLPSLRKPCSGYTCRLWLGGNQRYSVGRSVGARGVAFRQSSEHCGNCGQHGPDSLNKASYIVGIHSVQPS